MLTSPISWPNSTRFRPGGEVAYASEGGRTVLLDHARGEYFGLDEVGSRIWELIRERRDLGGIIDSLQAEYEVDPEILAADVRGLLMELCIRRLIAVE